MDFFDLLLLIFSLASYKNLEFKVGLCTFIKGVTFIPDSRVSVSWVMEHLWNVAKNHCVVCQKLDRITENKVLKIEVTNTVIILIEEKFQKDYRVSHLKLT